MSGSRIVPRTLALLVIGWLLFVSSGCTLGGVAPSIAEDAPPAPTPTPIIEEGHVESNGTRLYYRSVGSGPALIALHGMPADHAILAPALEPLADDYRVIFYDQRALGRSEGKMTPGEISAETFVQDLEGLRVALGLEKVHLLGQSWGGLLAMLYATEYPDNVASLLLVAPRPPAARFDQNLDAAIREREMAMSPEARAALDGAIDAYFTDTTPETLAEFLRNYLGLLLYDPAAVERVSLDFTEQTAQNGPTVGSMIDTGLGQFDYFEKLAVIRSPTLVIHGAADAIPLEASQAIHEHIEGSRLVVMERSGHLPFAEEPDAFATLVRDFLAGASN